MILLRHPRKRCLLKSRKIARITTCGLEQEIRRTQTYSSRRQARAEVPGRESDVFRINGSNRACRQENAAGTQVHRSRRMIQLSGQQRLFDPTDYSFNLRIAVYSEMPLVFRQCPKSEYERLEPLIGKEPGILGGSNQIAAL
jgi:hypothetical protein